MSAATNTTARQSPRRSRAGRACDFCRLRKARPQCQNCQSRSIDCAYAPKTHRPRPSNALIEQLKEQNDALQAQLHRERTSPGSGHDRQTTTRRRPSQHTPAPAQRGGESGTDRLEEPVNHIINATARNQQAAAPPVAHHVACLTAEAAKQRHLEQIAFRHDALQFGHINSQQGAELLALFWNRQHATGSVVYRPTFMRDMIVGGPYFSPLLLQAMLLYALRCSPNIVGFDSSPEGSHAASLPFRKEFNRQLHDEGGRLMTESRITTIQALLLMSDVLFAWLDERSTAWHYLGMATSMIVDLGMHTERDISGDGLPHLQQLETRRRVFWAAFVLDKVQSIYQGKPTRLRDIDCDVPVLFLDEFEELEPFKAAGFSLEPNVAGSPTYSVSHLTHLCNLSIIADRILCEMYTEKSRQRSSASQAQSLQQQLDGWRSALPAQFASHTDALKVSDALPHVLSLCKAALAIDGLLRCYKAQFCMTTPPYFITYAVYASATIQVRSVAQQASAATHYEPLLNCLEIMSSQSRRNRATSRMKNNLLELVNRLDVDIGGHFTEDGWERDNRAGEEVQGSATFLDEPNATSSTEAHYQIDHGLWSPMPELFLDLDPLFGFQAPDFDMQHGFGGL